MLQKTGKLPNGARRNNVFPVHQIKARPALAILALWEISLREGGFVIVSPHARLRER